MSPGTRAVFLGTGTSHGVPVIACSCPVCGSSDPRDRRYRSSLLIESESTTILVDATPEFRLQALRAGIGKLDALLLTHAHADHLHGLDDIRPLTHREALPVYGNRATLAELRERFSYAFRQGPVAGGKPRMELRTLESGTFRIGDIEVTPLPILHGTLPILGWRFGAFAWLPDCSAIPPATLGLLAGLESAAIDGLRARPHPTHFSVGEAIAAGRKLGLRELWLIHMTHDHSHREYEALCAELGADVGARPAWDGLEIRI